MYYGEYSSKLDDKGRVSVPRRFKVNMEAYGHVRWYMTRGFDGCIALYHQESWDKIDSQLSQFPSMDAQALDFRRLFFGGAADTQVDGQGRMTIPQHLRSFAGVDDDKDAVMIGVNDHLEIWSKAAWDSFQKASMSQVKEMAAGLFQPPAARVETHDKENG